jgi:hypothetical protein
MKGNAYTALGWLVWLVGKKLARRQLAKTRTKVGAAAVIALVLAIGLAGARTRHSE